MVIMLLAERVPIPDKTPFLNRASGFGRLQQRTQEKQRQEKNRHQHRVLLAAAGRFSGLAETLSSASPQAHRPHRGRYLQTGFCMPAPGIFPCLHLLASFGGHGLLLLLLLACACHDWFFLAPHKARNYKKFLHVL